MPPCAELRRQEPARAHPLFLPGSFGLGLVDLERHDAVDGEALRRLVHALARHRLAAGTGNAGRESARKLHVCPAVLAAHIFLEVGRACDFGAALGRFRERRREVALDHRRPALVRFADVAAAGTSGAARADRGRGRPRNPRRAPTPAPPSSSSAGNGGGATASPITSSSGETSGLPATAGVHISRRPYAEQRRIQGSAEAHRVDRREVVADGGPGGSPRSSLR